MESKKSRCVAIVLAAGAGKRMQSQVKKQFLMIKEKQDKYYIVLDNHDVIEYKNGNYGKSYAGSFTRQT